MKNLNPWAKNNKTLKIERKRREKEEHENSKFNYLQLVKLSVK